MRGVKEQAMAAGAKERKHLELEVSDFGPIARARIELRPLTVFVGPSNTGKSYLAILVYALHRFFESFTPIPGWIAGRTSAAFRRRYLTPVGRDYPLNTEAMEVILEWLAAMPLDKRTLSGNQVSMPPTIARYVWSQIEEDHGENFAAMLGDMFGIAAQELTRYHASVNCTIRIRNKLSSKADAFPVEYVLTIGNRPHSSVTRPLDAPISLNYAAMGGDLFRLVDYARNPRSELSDAMRMNLVEEFTNSLAAAFTAILVEPLNARSYYLPADRTGIMHAHQVIVSSLIRGAARAGLRTESPLRTLSGVLADFLEGLLDLNRAGIRHRHPSSADNFARTLEDDILSGSILTEESMMNYPIYSYQPSGWKRTLPLMNASSMISELAPVVLFLRHAVQVGDTLIIEEPEAHLHPAMQREFTRQIAAMVRSGIRVIITTHSEWVLEELANLVYLSNVPKERTQGIEGASVALTKDQIGVWLFESRNRPRGSVVRELPLNVNIGSFDSGFDEVSRSLYNNWADITSLLNGNGG